MLKFITYVIVIFIMMAFFGFQSGIVEIKNPNRVPYDKTKHWSIED